MGEEQLSWLQQFTHLSLSHDEARALILAKETGAVDNAGLRAVTDLDTLAASQVLGRLHHHYRLLEKGGAGPATYYQLSQVSPTSGELGFYSTAATNTGDLVPNTGNLAPNTGNLEPNTGNLEPNTGNLPESLQVKIEQLSPKARKEKIWPVIVWLCALQPLKAERLAEVLGNRQVSALKSNHINVLRDNKGFLMYTHPEVVNHPEQAYVTTAKGREWLEEQGIPLGDKHG